MRQIKSIIGAAALFIAYAIQAQTQISGSEPIPRDQLPPFGTYWFAKGPTGDGGPPLPFPPDDPGLPVYALANGQYLIDDSSVAYPALKRPGTRNRATYSTSSLDMLPPGEDGGPYDPPPPAPNIPNYQKFMGQAFSLIDTNDAAANDTNLYSACISFPDDTNTAPTLQIARYGSNAVIIKANHFDYSAETTRDFALLICDKVETPTWKSIDLSSPSNTQDGWLIQGLVSNWKVTDPMFLMVSNLNLAYNGFFQAIPYSGPQVTLTTPQPYDTVSNTVAVTAAITDLSGTTNQPFALTVNGLPARFTLGSNNTVNVDTRYAPNGSQELELSAGNNSAMLFDPQNPTADTKTAFANTATLPLDFENDTYLVWASDNCSPSVGTTYILFAVSKAQQIAATITDPSNGQTVASYAGYVPYPAVVEIPWDFTEADGLTPYSNETYSVTFTAFDPTTLAITNRIERYGVRQAAGCIVTYEEEDPALSAGPYLNSEASKWIGAVAVSYDSLYYWDWASLTQFSPYDIGSYRDNPPSEFPYVLTGNFQLPWAAKVFYALTNLAYSDFGYYTGHGSGTGLGGSLTGFVTGYIDTTTVYPYVHAPVPNWRMRKVAVWACYSDPTPNLTADYTIKGWEQAFGIRSTAQQRSSLMTKNVGLFFIGDLPQGGYSGTFGGTCSEVAAMFDDLWVTGPYPYPGDCDPTYAFFWAANQIEGMCPLINKALPAWIGFGYLPYTGIYDGELVTNNVSHIHR
jgi:hypothetical protein